MSQMSKMSQVSGRAKSLVAAALLLSYGLAAAQAPENASLESVSGEADLVFQGTVTGITYAASIEGIPHTFVTYRVEDVLKGDYRAPTLTLRFIGGFKQEGKVIRRLSVSHAPLFESGQQDLLMVKGNNSAQCPLASCGQGRFRFEKGLVANDSGDVLARDPQGALLALPRAQQQEATGDFGAGASVSAPLANPVATPFDRSGFVAHVRQVIGQQRSAAAVKPVQSADPSRPFKGPDPAVAPPPRENAVPQPVQPRGAASPQAERSRQEAEAVRLNGGNPVLPAAAVEALRGSAAR